VTRLVVNPHVLRRFLRPPLTEAPSLHRSYPASSVVRTSPPPHTARPGSRELPVDPDCDHRWGFPCCLWSPMRTCRRHYPGRFNGAHSLVYLHCQRPSPCNSKVGSCNCFFGACSAFTHVTACTLAESPSDPLHRELRQLRCLRCRLDCFRVERTVPGREFSPAGVQRLSRRTVTTTDLMLHRIANQRGYNLASRSMDLQAVAFPALVAADDGWVQYLSEVEELSVWTTVCNQEQQATCRFSTTATIELGKWTASIPRSLRVCTQD